MPWTRDQMAARAAKELEDGFYVNLGIGIPTLVSNFIPDGMSVQLQSENGMLGLVRFPSRARKPRPHQRRQANRHRAADDKLFQLGGLFRHDSRRPYRHRDPWRHAGGGNGDLANWMIPGKMVKGMGGAMDLVGGVKKVVVVMEHSAKNEAKLLHKSTCR